MCIRLGAYPGTSEKGIRCVSGCNIRLGHKARHYARTKGRSIRQGQKPMALGKALYRNISGTKAGAWGRGMRPRH
jgi:hypothetical protein